LMQAENGAAFNALLSPITQGLIDDAKTALNLTEGHYAMFPVDVPNDTHHSVIVANVEQTSSSSASSSLKASERAIGVCSAVPNGNGHDPYGSTSPWIYARIYLKQYENTKVAEDTPHKITVLENPTHGVLDEDNGDFQYQPKATYFGKDRVTFLVEMDGKQIKVVYFIHVLQTSLLGNTTRMDACSDYGTNLWKISSLPTGTDPTTITYSNLINSALDAFKGFSDLPAGEVGKNNPSVPFVDIQLAG
jgi:hypothetical protein